VRDGARAFQHTLANYASMVGKPYNVGLSSANISKQELCELIQTHVPEFTFMVANIGKDPDQRNYIVSNARIESTGFATTIDLDGGIRDLLSAYQVVRRNQYSNV
jgi:nucleoside-diphosphate-sugar epimerase